MRRHALLIALSLLLAAGGAKVHAAEPVPVEAKKHVDIGVAHYEAGRYEEAIKEFELAYRLSHRPGILFNIARAEAKLGHEENAIAFLRKYLEERPNADDAPAVLAEIEAREKALAAARDKAESDRKKAAAEAEAAEARKRAERVTAEAAEAQRLAEERQKATARIEAQQRRRTENVLAMKRAGISLVVIGPVIAAVGIGLGVAAKSAADEVSAALPGTEWSNRYAGLESRGKAFNVSGIALDVVGVAALAAGAGLLGYAFMRKEPASDRAWLIVPTGNGVAAGGTF